MAILDSIGTSLKVGNQKVIHGSTITFSSYIVESSDDGEAEVDMEDINNEDGALTTRLIYKRLKKVKLNLISKSDATPLADFPRGNMCTLAGLTGYFVDSCSISKSKSPERVSVDLTLIGIT